MKAIPELDAIRRRLVRRWLLRISTLGSAVVASTLALIVGLAAFDVSFLWKLLLAVVSLVAVLALVNRVLRSHPVPTLADALLFADWLGNGEGATPLRGRSAYFDKLAENAGKRTLRQEWPFVLRRIHVVALSATAIALATSLMLALEAPAKKQAARSGQAKGDSSETVQERADSVAASLKRLRNRLLEAQSTEATVSAQTVVERGAATSILRELAAAQAQTESKADEGSNTSESNHVQRALLLVEHLEPELQSTLKPMLEELATPEVTGARRGELVDRASKALRRSVRDLAEAGAEVAESNDDDSAQNTTLNVGGSADIGELAATGDLGAVDYSSTWRDVLGRQESSLTSEFRMRPAAARASARFRERMNEQATNE